MKYEDDEYSNFMTKVMQSLEIRKINKYEMIARELDECDEILFVFQGRYNIGYEINRKNRYMK